MEQETACLILNTFDIATALTSAIYWVQPLIINMGQSQIIDVI